MAGNVVFIEAAAVVRAHRKCARLDPAREPAAPRKAGFAVPPDLRAMIDGIGSPGRGYHDHLNLHLGSRLVRVRSMPAHTGGDSVVAIPDAGVVVTGDLFWHRGLANLIDATTASWIETLDALAAAGPSSTFVPGHGSVGQAADVTAFREYLATLRRLVSEARARRISRDALAATITPSLVRSYGEWHFSSTWRLRTSCNWTRS